MHEKRVVGSTIILQRWYARFTSTEDSDSPNFTFTSSWRRQRTNPEAGVIRNVIPDQTPDVSRHLTLSRMHFGIIICKTKYDFSLPLRRECQAETEKLCTTHFLWQLVFVTKKIDRRLFIRSRLLDFTTLISFNLPCALPSNVLMAPNCCSILIADGITYPWEIRVSMKIFLCKNLDDLKLMTQKCHWRINSEWSQLANYFISKKYHEKMYTKAKGDRLKVVDLVAGIEYVVRCVLGCAAHRTHQVPRATNLLNLSSSEQCKQCQWSKQISNQNSTQDKRHEPLNAFSYTNHNQHRYNLQITDAGVKDRVIIDHKRWCHLIDLHHQHYLLSYSCFIFIAYLLLMEMGSSNSQRMMDGRHLK